ncbi:MAG: GNAT family N-acetyltransferase [Patescibacteria group bacterium]
MTIERETWKEPDRTPLDPSLAKAYVNRDLPEVRRDFAQKGKDDGKILYALHPEEDLLGKGGALQMLYTQTGKTPVRFMHFSYFVPSSDSGELRQEVASMLLEEKAPGVFILVHRFVNPELRGGGVGSRLLSHLEAWLMQIANARGEKVELHASIGQKNPLFWFVDRGYLPEDQASVDLLEELIKHPERFVNGDGISVTGIEHPLYRADEEGNPSGPRVSVALQKTFSPSVR